VQKHSDRQTGGRTTPRIPRMSSISFLFLNLLLLPTISTSLFSGLFPVRGVSIAPARTSDFPMLATFFTDAFWVDKKNGSRLSERSIINLRTRQLGEFKKRYSRQGKSVLLVASRPIAGGRSAKRKTNISKSTAALLGAEEEESALGEIIGCVAVDASTLIDASTGKRLSNVPVMSNLAVGKKWRGRGVATRLVHEIEMMASKLYNSDNLFLKVDASNNKARKLYRKNGYIEGWREEVNTLTPSGVDMLETFSNVYVMAKKLNK